MPRQRTDRDKASECALSAGMIAAANESLDDLYLARGVACCNMWDYGCYFARRNDRHVFNGPQIPWRLESLNVGTRVELMYRPCVLYPLQSWSNWHSINQYRLARKIASNLFAWGTLATAWMPLDDWLFNFPSAQSRNRGRPPKRCVQ